MDTIEKCKDALRVLRRISTSLDDQGFCGPKGRVVLSWMGRSSGVEVTGMFSRLLKGQYALEFTLKTHPNSNTLDIIRAATLIAELQEACPKFTEEETAVVFMFLEGAFGPLKVQAS